MVKAFHFLKDNMTAGEGTEPAWKIGEERDIGDDNLQLCQRGYHSSPSWYNALQYAPGNMACIVDVSKPIKQESDKQVSRKRKLVACRNAEKVLRAWGCDCAERALKKAGVIDERSWNVIKIARQYNSGKATSDELAAARSSARNAAENAARNAAESSARNAEIQWQRRHFNKLMANLFKEGT